MRADAVRNRERLVEAAATAFRDRGLDVSVNAIAATAGVNVATLYRHFPTKDALVGAVLEAVLEPLVAARDRALADGGGRALEAFLREAARQQDRHRGFVDALGASATGLAVRTRLGEAAAEIVAPLVQRAHADGELRPELDALDLLLALRMLADAAAVDGAGSDRARRARDALLRGLR